MTKSTAFVTLMLGTLMFSGTFALGQSESQTSNDQYYKQQIATFQKQLDAVRNGQNGSPSLHDLEMDADNLGGSVDSLQRQINGATEQVQDDTTQVGSDAKNWLGFGGASDQKKAADAQKLQDDLAALNKLKASYAGQKTDYDKAYGQYQQVLSQNKQLLTKIKNAKSDQTYNDKTIQTELDGLKASLSKSQLDNDFSKIQMSHLKISDALNQVDAHYNTTILGVYLQDEISKVLGSDALCHAVSNCSGGKGHYVPNATDMKQIFNGLNTKYLRNQSQGNSSSQRQQ